MPERKSRRHMPHHQTDPAEIPTRPESSGLAEKTSPVETNIQSFIVKVWLGEFRGAPGRPTWRGYITHVPSGRRRYLKKLGDVTACMAPYINPRTVLLPGDPGLKPAGESRLENPSIPHFRMARKASAPARTPKSKTNLLGVLHRPKQNKKLRSVQKGKRRTQGSSPRRGS
jgi:hypothetical protein